MHYTREWNNSKTDANKFKHKCLQTVSAQSDLKMHKLPSSHHKAFWFIHAQKTIVACEFILMCVCKFVWVCMHESPSAAEFDTDGEPSCLDAIDQNPVFLSSQMHTRTHAAASTPLLSPPFSLYFSAPFWIHFCITHPLVLRQTDQTTSHNEVALHHHKHCCVSKWAGEEAGSISALFSNYLLQAEHRWGREAGGKRRRDRGEDIGLKERRADEWEKRRKATMMHIGVWFCLCVCVCDAL